jgi:hypothetical protein
MGAGGVIPPPKTYFEKVNYNIIMNLIFLFSGPQGEKKLEHCIQNSLVATSLV